MVAQTNMDKVRIGEYEIEPQVGSAAVRCVVKRVHDPHRIGYFYVHAHFDGAGQATYKVSRGDRELDGEFWASWSEGVADAMNRIEALHAQREETRIQQEHAETQREIGRQRSVAELALYIRKVQHGEDGSEE